MQYTQTLTFHQITFFSCIFSPIFHSVTPTTVFTVICNFIDPPPHLDAKGFPPVICNLESVNVLVTLSCLTLCNPMDCSPPDSSVHIILKARILEGVLFPSPEDLPNTGIKPGSPSLQTDSLPSELQGVPKSLILVLN